MTDVENGTGTAPTEESVASDFESLLSEEPEYQETNESQPDPKQAPDLESQSDEVEGSSEQPQPDEDETEQTEESEEQTDPSIPVSLDPNLKVKVKVDGTEEEITLGEALKGYSREAVFTRRMQEVAEQRKAVEAYNQSLRAEREAYATKVAQVQELYEQQQVKEPDWVQIQRDHPDKFANLWAQWSQYKGEVEAVAKERAEAEAVVRRDREHARQERVKAEKARLLEVIPEWKDEAKAKAERQQMAKYAIEVAGFTEEDLAGVDDHRPFVLLRKAMLWDNLQKQKPNIDQRIQAVRTATPGSPTNRVPMSKAKAAFGRLAKSGSIEDFAAGLEEILDDE